MKGAPTTAESLSPVAVEQTTVAPSVSTPATVDGPGTDAEPALQSADSVDQPLNAELVRQFADKYYKDIYRYAYRLSGTAAEAEDLTQQTFLMALQRIHQLREQSRAKAWLFAILRSCFLKSCRKRVPVTAANLELDIGMIPDGVRELEVDSERLQNALNELPAEFRLVLVMFYFEQCSYKEIASGLEIAPGTVMSRLARAKRQLRYKLVSTGGTAVQIKERTGADERTSSDSLSRQ